MSSSGLFSPSNRSRSNVGQWSPEPYHPGLAGEWWSDPQKRRQPDRWAEEARLLSWDQLVDWGKQNKPTCLASEAPTEEQPFVWVDSEDRRFSSEQIKPQHWRILVLSFLTVMRIERASGTRCDGVRRSGLKWKHSCGVYRRCEGRRHPVGAASLTIDFPTLMNRELHAEQDWVWWVPVPADGCIFLERPRCQQSPWLRYWSKVLFCGLWSWASGLQDSLALSHSYFFQVRTRAWGGEENPAEWASSFLKSSLQVQKDFSGLRRKKLNTLP